MKRDGGRGDIGTQGGDSYLWRGLTFHTSDSLINQEDMKLLRGGRREVGRVEPGKGKAWSSATGGGIGERIWTSLWREKGVGGG